MSVQKFIIAERKLSFTTVPNKVLQNLRNLEALGLYCYLASLPPNWTFYKNEIREHTNIGIHKLNNLLKILEISGLIITSQVREGGRFSHFLMNVLDGNDFKINELSPCYKNRNTVTVLRKSASINNTYPSNDTKLKKQRGEKSKKLSVDKFDFTITDEKKRELQELGIDYDLMIKKFKSHLKEKGKKFFTLGQLEMWTLREEQFAPKPINKKAGAKAYGRQKSDTEKKFDDQNFRKEQNIKNKAHVKAIKDILGGMLGQA